MPYSSATRVAIFCKVVDNYGDIGICWRLARQLRHEHGLAVTLWVDDLQSFRRLCPEVEPASALQWIEGVEILHWRDQQGNFSPEDVADIVIEFFGCDIPPGYVAAMAACKPRPAWLNLEGLTAEEWVEGCHTLPSPHPRMPLTKHFFFPGFTVRTGGLLHESELEEQRTRFLFEPGTVAAFLARLGVTGSEAAALKISMFCYPSAPLAPLFDAWARGNEAVLCLVPEGVAREAVADFLAVDPVPGAAATRGALTVRVLPFVPQPDYDRLLWACDLNFVRGEDSFVRAQWAERPFVWHIYPQDKNLHHVKLRAFLQRYAGQGEGGAAQDALAVFSLAWNGATADQPDWPTLWVALRAGLPLLERQAAAWKQQMLAHGDLAGNLLKFVAALPRLTEENKV